MNARIEPEDFAKRAREAARTNAQKNPIFLCVSAASGERFAAPAPPNFRFPELSPGAYRCELAYESDGEWETLLGPYLVDVPEPAPAEAAAPLPPGIDPVSLALIQQIQHNANAAVAQTREFFALQLQQQEQSARQLLEAKEELFKRERELLTGNAKLLAGEQRKIWDAVREEQRELVRVNRSDLKPDKEPSVWEQLAVGMVEQNSETIAQLLAFGVQALAMKFGAIPTAANQDETK